MQSKTLIFLFCIILGLLVANCTTVIPTGTPELANIALTPTIEIPVLPTPTITLTKTPEPTSEITSTPNHIRAKFMKLYSTNGNCSLPCWWGIIPGKTTLNEVHQLFAEYPEFIFFDENPDRLILNYLVSGAKLKH